jgi:1-acyl-sn-glycerol-3-phosphate acyltransferase
MSDRLSHSQISPWLTPIAYFLSCRLIIPCYFKTIKIEGQDYLPRTGAAILAPTHRSRWDAILLAYAAGRWVTGRDLRYMVLLQQTQGFQGWFIQRLGGFPINRENPGKSSIRYSIELLKQEQILVLFPEGHIFLDPELHPIQPGVARIALQTLSQKPDLDLKIIPISIRYDSPAPIHQGSCVKIKIGVPLQVNHYIQPSIKVATNFLTSDLEMALKTLHHQ